MTNNHAPNAIAMSERVYLRLLNPGDAAALSAASHLEPEVTFADDGHVPASILAFEHLIEQLDEHRIPRQFVFAICRIGDDTCIGTTSIRDIDWVHRTGETGTGLLTAEDRGHGLGTEAKHLLLRYAFEVLGLHAIRSLVFSGNARSTAALAKQGYRYAGRLTAFIQKGGAYRDEFAFDVLHSDWVAAHANWQDARLDRPAHANQPQPGLDQAVAGADV